MPYDHPWQMLPPITEASGGPDERATTFTWHSAYAFPETITRASASSGTVTDESLL